MTNLLRKTLFQLISLSVIFAVVGCVDVPEFSDEPKISFSRIEFANIDDLSTEADEWDTLALSINFEDGNGDLGIDDSYPPFNDVYYFANFYLHPDSSRLILYEDRSMPEYDTLPPYNSNTACTNWFIVNEELVNSDLFLIIDDVYFFDQTNNYLGDTLYYQRNIFHYNIYVDFYVQQGASFIKYEFPGTGCEIDYNGRFPTNVNPGGPENDRALEGSLTYNMAMSPAFLLEFNNDTMFLEITIYDRSFNKSNTIRTPEFTLESIQKG